MPAARDDQSVRRSLVPQAASRSLWLSAAWTGAGTALVGAVLAIVAVAVCWLPASGSDGSSGSAVRAGLLTFLASLHAGLTLDGVDAAFLPLGMTIAVGVTAWRAGAGLADAAADLDEAHPGRLIRAGALQAVAFAAVCALMAAVATLGTSSVSVLGAGFAGLVLFAVTGGVALVRSSCLADEFTARSPGWLAPAARGAVVAVAVYLAAGALLVAGALVVHHSQVETLSRGVGGGWSGVPVLLLGILAAPNAVIAGSGYLAGPGFAIGSGSGVSLGSSAHGLVPAFPVLGALPAGPATALVWLLAVLTPVCAGGLVAALARREGSWTLRWRDAGLSAAGAAVLGLLLAWQGGGAIGSGRLTAVGVSPWQFALAVGAAVGVVAAVVLGALQGLELLRARDEPELRPLRVVRSTITAVASAAATVTGTPDQAGPGTPSDDEDEPVAAPDEAAEGGKRAG